MSRRTTATIVIAAGLTAAVTPVSAQDLFSLLFGSPQPRRFSPFPARPPEPVYRVRERWPTSYDPALGSSSLDYGASLGVRDPAYSADPADQGMLKMFLTDRTLARGDIVVTKTGFRVFRGSSSFPHAPSDFVPLQAANLRNLTQLMALEATLAPPLKSSPDESEGRPQPSQAGAPDRSR